MNVIYEALMTMKLNGHAEVLGHQMLVKLMAQKMSEVETASIITPSMISPLDVPDAPPSIDKAIEKRELERGLLALLDRARGEEDDSSTLEARLKEKIEKWERDLT